MPIRPLASAPEATTRLVACMSLWSHVRRRNPRSKELTRQHLHLRLSHFRKCPKKKNPKKWRSLYCLMMMRRTPFKTMSRSLPWDGLQRSGTSQGVNPPSRTTDLWGFFRSTTLIGTQLWCNEHMHPLEDTYWKTRVCISIRDGEKEAYQLDSNYAHHAHCATIEDSMKM